MKSRKGYLQDFIRKIEDTKEKVKNYQNPIKTDSYRNGFIEELDYLETYLKLLIEDKEEAASDHFEYANGINAAFEWFEHNIHFNSIKL